ncbi:hypothetical protein GQ44DRAFT_826878 [Phaeosphaeriaceae sp. PMI808]|nr:hypothetical protein GQ44DRAFT_826878 [Phaeosphaeriaceae sp. PMI808]
MPTPHHPHGISVTADPILLTAVLTTMLGHGLDKRFILNYSQILTTVPFHDLAAWIDQVASIIPTMGPPQIYMNPLLPAPPVPGAIKPATLSSTKRPFSLSDTADAAEQQLVSQDKVPLLPDGTPRRMLLCPISGCEKVYMRFRSSAKHFKESHVGCYFVMDNLEGDC